MLNLPKALGLFAVVLSLTHSVAHAETRIQSDIGYRKDLMFAMDWNLVRIAQMLRRQVPYNRARLAREGQALQALSNLPWVAFVPGSDVGQTKAKPGIWQHPRAFQADARHFEGLVQSLNAAAAGGSLARVARPLEQVAQSCKSCHHRFLR